MRVAWIDVLKLVAILMVVTVHVSQVVPAPEWAKLCCRMGAMGVQLFFLMSAYCLCMTWKERPLTWHWWWRKYCRFAPWYISGIVLYLTYHALVRDGLAANYTIGNVVMNVLLINGFIPSAQNAIVPGGWSISCIALFVFAWPLLRNFQTATLIAVGVMGLTISSIGYLCFGWSRLFTYCSPFNQFIVFALGMALFRWKDRVRTSWAVTMSIVFPLLAVAAVVFGREYNILYRHVLMALSFFGFAVILMRGKIVWPRWVLWIGRNSYEIFILHFLVIWCVKRMA